MSHEGVKDGQTDDLSPFAQRVLASGLADAYTHLVVTGAGMLDAKLLLQNATPEQMLSSAVRDGEHAQAMLCGLWLWHDWLGQSHVISQSLHSASGSFWHAIMHRREGDFSNSKYWYARSKHHPVLESLAQNANQLIHPLPADKSLLRLINHGWNADAFVDLVEDLHQRPDDPRHRLAVSLQQMEWRLLFDHCTRVAAGK